MRDEFPQKVKDILAKRVGFHCSNPGCQRSTSGPSARQDESVNIGVAAHITAASPGGPRYDPSLSTEERKSPGNGVWLCQTCGKLVDSDPETYNFQTLHEWKASAEARAEGMLRSWAGVAALDRERTLVTADTALLGSVEHLSARISVSLREQLQRKREDLREGRRGEVIHWVSETKADSMTWLSLADELKAEILRLEAQLELGETGSITRARELAEQARDLTPLHDQSVLLALITHRESGPEAATQLLEGKPEIDSRNLHASLLLEVGQVDESLEVLDVNEAGTFEGSEIKPNAETYRIRAIAHLLSKNIPKARLEIQKALELAPHWETVRFTVGMIEYFSALSHAALPPRLVRWPEPVHPALLKSDERSLRSVRGAARVFLGLSETAEMGVGSQRDYETWRLACLANDPEAQEQAVEFCQSLLTTDPTNFRAVAWAVTFGSAINLGPSEEALDMLVSKGEASLEHVIALLESRLALGYLDKAHELLSSAKHLFGDRKAEPLWELWLALVRVAAGELDLAEQMMSSSAATPGAPHVRTVLLKGLARKSGDSQQLSNHLQESYEQTGDVRFLLESCALKADMRDWSYVADHATELVEGVATPDSFRLAVMGAYNARRYDLCLDLLDSKANRGMFESHKLPAELRRIRVLCLKGIGVLPEAIAEQEELAREDSSKEDLLDLAALYSRKGDLKNLAVLAGRMMKRPDLNAEEALRAAWWVRWEDLELARSFWRRAVAGEIPDDVVGPAVSLGFQLGLDDELGPMMERMTHLGTVEGAGIVKASLAEFVDFFKKHRENVARSYELYRAGKVPVHAILEVANWSMADPYHLLLGENETAPTPLDRFPLFAIHGSRVPPTDFSPSASKWRLNIDISSFLLAAHLELLDTVEESFAPLRIPAELIQSLIRARDNLSHHQPRLIQACKLVVDLVEEGSIQIAPCEVAMSDTNREMRQQLGADWVAMFECVQAGGGFIVDFLPPSRADEIGESADVPDVAKAYLVNCRSIVEALWKHGPLSEREYRDFLGKLGQEGSKPVSESIPPPGSSLYCVGNIPEVLAEAGLLLLVSQNFNLHAQKQEIERSRAGLAVHDKKSDGAQWAANLIERVSKGIDGGVYELIQPSPTESDSLGNLSGAGPEMACLLSLLRFEAGKNDLVWADDRYVNGFIHRASVPIASILDVLRLLVSSGVLESIEYYRAILRLRSANARFISLESKEIMHHLMEARVQNGHVVETRELRVLRQYAAACLLEGSILQRPQQGESSAGGRHELAFLAGLGRAVAEALVELWADADSDEESRVARADWLVSNLYLDHPTIFRLTSMPRAQQDDRYAVALSLSFLISHAMRLESDSSESGSTPQQRYIHWLFERVLRRRIDADRHFVKAIAEALRKSLSNIQEEKLLLGEKPFLVLLLQRFYEDLPDTIREELGHDTDFLAAIGIRLIEVIELGGLSFNASEFWPAATEAVNGREVKIAPIGKQVEAVFKPLSPPGRNGFLLDHPDREGDGVNTSKDMGLLLKSPSQREEYLRRERHWFDCEEARFERAVAEIVSIDDDRLRVQRAQEWWESSATRFYADLQLQLDTSKRVERSDLLPPSAEGLVRHFRLPEEPSAGQGFGELTNAAAARLVKEEGLETAIRRFSTLPTPLPPTIVESIESLPPEGKRSLVKNIVAEAPTPLSRIHSLRAILACGGRGSPYYRLARRKAPSLFVDDARSEFKAFHALLRWVSEEFNHWPGTRAWSASVRLAMSWGHAARLYSIFASSGVSLDKMRSFFSEAATRLPSGAFQRDREHWLDIAHPRQLTRLTFLWTGLSYGLGDHLSGFSEKGLCDAFTREVFERGVDGKVAFLPLLRDRSLASDSLGSFLRMNPERLAPLLDFEEAAKTSQQSLKSLVEKALTSLEADPTKLFPWLQLQAVLGDLPPYPDLTPGLKKVIQQADFGVLFQEDLRLGIFAANAASQQLANLNDEFTTSHFRSQLPKIAELLREAATATANGHSEDSQSLMTDEVLRLHLLEWALNTARAEQSSEKVLSQFSDLVTLLTERWPGLVPTARIMVQRFCEELPISDAQYFWPLLVRLRAA